MRLRINDDQDRCFARRSPPRCSGPHTWPARRQPPAVTPRPKGAWPRVTPRDVPLLQSLSAIITPAIERGGRRGAVRATGYLLASAVFRRQAAGVAHAVSAAVAAAPGKSTPANLLHGQQTTSRDADHARRSVAAARHPKVGEQLCAAGLCCAGSGRPPKRPRRRHAPGNRYAAAPVQRRASTYPQRTYKSPRARCNDRPAIAANASSRGVAERT